MGIAKTSQKKETPAGSVDESSYAIYGTGGNQRHGGSFSSNNPYLDQLYQASANNDIDALYERAVEWQADYANLQEQREYNRQVLEEQREYDSTINRVARDRAAGINSDVQAASVGSSGTGSSSAQMQIPAMADQQGQSKFSNAYDNANLALSAVNTAVNAISSIGGFAGSVIDSVGKVAELPSRISLSKTTADVASRSADAMVQQNKNNAFSSTVDLFSKVSPYVTEDLSDEDALFALSGITGMSDADASAFLPKLRAYQQSPAAQKVLSDYSLASKKSAAQNKAASAKILTAIARNSMATEYMTSVGNVHTARFSMSLANLMDSQSFITKTHSVQESSLDSQLATNEYNTKSMEFATTQLADDIIAYTKYLSFVKDEIAKCDQEYMHIVENEPLTDANIAYLHSLEVQKMNFELLGSKGINVIGSMVAQSYFSSEHRKLYVNDDGSIKNQSEVPDQMFYFQPLFQQFLNGQMTQAEIATAIAKRVDHSLAERQFELNQQQFEHSSHMDKVKAAISVAGLVSNAFSNFSNY